MLLVPGGLDPRFALSSYRRFFGLRSLLAVSSVASGRIEFVSRAFQARQFYGLSFRFQLLSTPRRRNAVTFNSWREAPPQRDFHPPMHAHSQAHERDRPGRSVWRLAEHIFARHLSRIAIFSPSIFQRPILENRSRVRRETLRTATGTVALPNHASAIIPSEQVENVVEVSSKDLFSLDLECAQSSPVKVNQTNLIRVRQSLTLPYYVPHK